MEKETVNETMQIKRMKPHVEKLVKYLTVHGITFQHSDGKTPNVIITKEGHTPWICAHQMFYRFSGLCVIGQEVRKGKSTEFKLVPVDDDDVYINTYVKALVDRYFKIK